MHGEPEVGRVRHVPLVHAPPVEPPVPIATSLTVVIPTNRRDALPTALASLAAQTDKDFDVLVVDNSLDGEVARSLTVYSTTMLYFSKVAA